MDMAYSTVWPVSSQTAVASRAMPMTTGTKTPLTLSASLEMGALEALASSTRWMIWARAVSSPTLMARKVKAPVLLTEAPVTVSPGPFSTGIDSPVRALSSTAVAPDSTTPSTGMEAPGLTAIRSPICTSSTGISRSSPSRMTRALGMEMRESFSTCRLERIS